MRILVTGGTGVIGNGVIPELLRRKHEVRLLSRHAQEDARQWHGVEPFAGDVADPSSLRGAADGCDAILHIAGIAEEHPPETTFAKINVGGTRNMLDLAAAANVRRFVFISSLGAERGTSEYHRSKLEAEQLVRAADREWLILRPGAVYGPGDEVISLLFKMVRTLPALAVLDDGKQEFQPVWYEDLAKAIATAIERDDLSRQIFEIAGTERTSMHDVIERIGRITDRDPALVPVPMPLASLAVKLASFASVPVPADENKLAMLRDHNVIPDGAENGLTLLGVTATPLDEGLRKLADAMPEQLPDEGVGAMHHKRFWADIRGTAHTAESLLTLVRERAPEIMPIEFETEPGTPQRLDYGATLTARIPGRGNIQIRVEVVEARRVVMATIEGHPLAGIVQFSTSPIDGGVRFAIDLWTRASNFFDLVALNTVGAPMQDANWREVTKGVVAASGGTNEEGVQALNEKLDEDEATEVESRIREMVNARKRDES